MGMSMTKHWKIVKDKESKCVPDHGVKKSLTQLNNNKWITMDENLF